MTPARHISEQCLARALYRYHEVLRARAPEIDALNVYPVPDSDTGTNMAHTVAAVVGELGGASTMAEVCAAMSHGSLMGARGNSGVILSQVFRGLSQAFSGVAVAGVDELIEGLRKAVQAAYDAVGDPVEGTILTVLRETTQAAEGLAAQGAVPLWDLLATIVACARDSLARTPQQLPALAEAGVVDAGGTGLLLFFESLLEVVDPQAASELPSDEAGPASVDARPYGDSRPRYEVVFFVEAGDQAAGSMRARLSQVGESIAVVGGEGTWKVHVHTDDVDAAVALGRAAGPVQGVEVVDLVDQVSSLSSSDQAHSSVVAVARSSALKELYERLGAFALLRADAASRVQAAIDGAGGQGVIVVADAPFDEDVLEVAGSRVGALEMVAGDPPVRSLAALLAFDPARSVEDNARSMRDAASAVAVGLVERSGASWCAVAAGGEPTIWESPLAALSAIVDRLATAGSEVVTVIAGDGIELSLRDRFRSYVRARHGHLSVEFHDGGDAQPPLVVGVE